jgi:glycosyltransferase involved in cell wall biosynthesis
MSFSPLPEPSSGSALPGSSIPVAVIIPCFNPQSGWCDTLMMRYTALQLAMQDKAIHWSLCIVDDGSLTPIEVPRQAFAIRLPANKGKGYALRQGVKTSNADYYLLTDADFPYTTDSMVKVLETVMAQGGIAAGNRNTAYYAHTPPMRRWLSKMLRFWLRHILRQPVDDSQCGLKAFDHQAKPLFLACTIDRFLYDIEFLMRANGRLNVVPVAVTLREGVVFSSVSLRTLTTEFVNLCRLLWLKINSY